MNIKSSLVRGLTLTVLGLSLFSSVFPTETFASNAVKKTMRYHTCYGTSNLGLNASKGDVIGTSTTICDRTTSFSMKSISVSGFLTRNDSPIDSESTTKYGVDKASVTTFYSDRVFRSGTYKNDSTHKAVSGYDSGDSLYWTSSWSRNF